MLKPSIYKAFYNNYKGYIISKELYKYKNIGIKEYIYKFKLFGKIVAVVFVALVATNFIGDQKQGNNIETPEALLRKIVREETAGRQAGGGSYRFTAQINRRTLFDEMMKEAQMRRDTSGRNPFEMA